MRKRGLLLIGLAATLLFSGCGRTSETSANQQSGEEKQDVKENVSKFLKVREVFEYQEAYDHELDYLSETQWKYDDNGNLAEVVSYDEGEYYSTEKYVYDENGKITEKIIYLDDGAGGKRLWDQEFYSYDENGRLIEVGQKPDTVWSYRQYSYDGNGNLWQINYYLSSEEVEKLRFYEFKYDEAGNLVKKEEYESIYEDGLVLSYYEDYEYDKDGRLIKIKGYYPYAGKLLGGENEYGGECVCEYEYDSYGNIIREKYTGDYVVDHIKICEYERFEEVAKVESDTIEESFEISKEEIVVEEKPQYENGLLFSSEYDIEDYCGGYFIVSKNDGLLYGVLNMEGKEWIPCEYDEISFLNKNKFVDGTDDTLLIKLRYENLYTVMNQSGEKVLDNVEAQSLDYADYEIGKISEDSVALALSYTLGEQTKGITLYDKTGDVLLEVELEGVTNFGFKTMISEEFFLAGSNLNNDHHKTYLYSMNGEIVNQWEGWAVIGARGFGTYYEDKAEIIFYYLNYHYWTIDSNGNAELVGEYTSDEYESMVRQEISNNMGESINPNDYSNEYFKLYKSNGTWKVENPEGVPMYDSRYYLCKTYKNYDGSYLDMIVVADENGEAIAVNRFGQKVIDKGWMTLNDGGGYTEVYFNGSRFDSTECYVEDSGICYIQGHDVYYFQPVTE